MSSARNHAKRSHRSEHFKTSTFNASARKMYIRQTTKPKRFDILGDLYAKVRRLFRRKNSEG